jgi:hypothetical protein
VSPSRENAGVHTPVASSCAVLTQFSVPAETPKSLPMPATAVGTTVSNVPSAKVTEASAATSSTAGAQLRRNRMFMR